MVRARDKSRAFVDATMIKGLEKQPQNSVRPCESQGDLPAQDVEIGVDQSRSD